MIYLDYSATTMVDNRVLEKFVNDSKKYFANPNSKHKLGIEANNYINDCSNNISKILKLNNSEIIYTSGSSEANNLALHGIAESYKNYGNHIITTSLEHSSIIGPLNNLQKNGVKVSFVKLDKNGLVDLNDLERIITQDTILVTINAVNSELGIKQDLNKISEVVHRHNNVIFHSDVTQAIGKYDIDLSKVDLFSFSAHKFYGIKGIGALIKKKDIRLTPIVFGGSSTTIYRSGTPCLPLISSLNEALTLFYNEKDYRIEKVIKIHDYLIKEIQNVPNIVINSNDYSIPNIVNISILNREQDYSLDYLSKNNIYVSTLSACSSAKKLSGAVFQITNDENRALTSIRISISHLTTIDEINVLIEKLKELQNEIN